jgi:glycosyltransferase involved in cell wall biosynthesis
VCHLIHGLQPGGAEQLLVEFADQASGLDIDTSVVSLMGLGEARYATQLERAGARVLTLGLRSRWDPRGFDRAVSTLGRLRPSVVHTHLKHADTIGAYASRRLRVPMVSTLHRIETGGTRLERFKQQVGGRARLAVAARTITVSEAQRRWYIDAFHAEPGKVVTVHNGIRPPKELAPGEAKRVREEIGVRQDELLVTMLGVMRPGKGHAQLLAAARLIPEAVIVRLALVGDGELASAIADEVRGDPRLQGRVVLTGWRTDVDRLLAASDMIAHPTLADALPTAVIHGLAAGLPVIASDVGGVPELVDAECGILVPPGDPVALAAAITGLVEDAPRRATMGRAARRRFDQEFTAGRWVEGLRRVYEDVLAE